jgi:hypothetical protein
MEIYAAEGKKFEGTVLLALQTNVGLDHHRMIHQDDFYNTVKFCQNLFCKEMQ